MRYLAIKFILIFSLFICFAKGYSQASTYQNYKFIGETIEDFEPIKAEMVSNLVQSQLRKEMKKHLSAKPDTILFSRAPNQFVCASFVGKRYERTYIIVDKNGNVNQTIICLNPEFQESNVIYKYATDNSYSISIISSPFGYIRKNIDPGLTWFEAFVDRTGDVDSEKVLIFNKNMEFLAIEKAR